MSKHPKKQDMFVEGEAEASFEDQVWLYWKKYNRHIILGAALLIFAYLGYFGVGLYQERQLDKLQEDYREALVGGHELTFAENNFREPLAGYVFLKAGDEAMKKGDYAVAIERYADSLKSLKNKALASRIRLSSALAKLFNDQKAEALGELEALTKDNKALDVDKAGAAYELTLLAMEEGNFEQAKQYLNMLVNIPNAGIWGEKGLILQNTTPEFGK